MFVISVEAKGLPPAGS